MESPKNITQSEIIKAKKVLDNIFTSQQEWQNNAEIAENLGLIEMDDYGDYKPTWLFNLVTR